MRFVLYLVTIITLLVYPLIGSNLEINTNIAMWQSVLASILNKTNKNDLPAVNDVNGDMKVDVCDLCIIVNKMKQNGGKLPKSPNNNSQYLCLNFSRYEKSIKSMYEVKEMNVCAEGKLEEFFSNESIRSFISCFVNPIVPAQSFPLRC